MANPSLQIGNDNWAIKEDNLLGYSTAGTRFVPQPITMTRATLGTRVNPSGLVEDVALLGSDGVTNGDFATDSDWTIEDVWTIPEGSANGNGANGSSQQLVQSSVFEIGKTYKVTYDIINYVSGSVFMPNVGSSNSGNGTYIEYITATQQDFKITGTNFYGSVTNVSAKEATIDNLPRVDYTDGTSSLLVEPMRTNLIEESEDFEDATYGEYLVSYTPNFATSPSGESNATKLTSSGVYGNINLNFTKATSSITYTQSIFIKPNNYTLVNFISYGASSSNRSQVTFDLSNGTISSAASSTGAFTNASATITSYTNDYYKVSLTYTTDSSAQVRPTISFPVEMDSTNYVIIWGYQLEEGSYATSYIPTDGGTVTRVQDQYSKTGISNLINSEEGVLFVEIAALSESNLNSYITIGQNTSTGILGISFYTGSNNILLDHWSSGASETYHLQPISDVTEFNKIAICYDGTSIKGYINGSPVWNTTVTAWSSNALSELNFAFGNSGTNKFLGKVKQLQVFKTALTDTELATLTT